MMLEKMARAIVYASGGEYIMGSPEDYWDGLPPMGRRTALQAARAALLAIREPDESMLKDCAWDRADGMNGPTSEVAEWQSGIDAILAEKS